MVLDFGEGTQDRWVYFHSYTLKGYKIQKPSTNSTDIAVHKIIQTCNCGAPAHQFKHIPSRILKGRKR